MTAHVFSVFNVDDHGADTWHVWIGPALDPVAWVCPNCAPFSDDGPCYATEAAALEALAKWASDRRVRIVKHPSTPRKGFVVVGGAS